MKCRKRVGEEKIVVGDEDRDVEEQWWGWLPGLVGGLDKKCSLLVEWRC